MRSARGAANGAGPRDAGNKKRPGPRRPSGFRLSPARQTLFVVLALGGIAAGYFLAYFKYVFDAEMARFEFKRNILRDLWEATFYAASAAKNLAPSFGITDPNETVAKRVERLLPDYSAKYNKARGIMQFNQPFYPKTLYDSADKLLIECFSLGRFVADPSRMALKDAEELIDNKITLLIELKDKFSEEIRVDMERPKSYGTIMLIVVLLVTCASLSTALFYRPDEPRYRYEKVMWGGYQHVFRIDERTGESVHVVDPVKLIKEYSKKVE